MGPLTDTQSTVVSVSESVVDSDIEGSVGLRPFHQIFNFEIFVIKRTQVCINGVNHFMSIISSHDKTVIFAIVSSCNLLHPFILYIVLSHWDGLNFLYISISFIYS